MRDARRRRTRAMVRSSARASRSRSATGRIVERDGEKIGVVQLLTFSSGAHGELRAEVDELLKKGAEGIVLDLRGNGGGLLREAVLVSSIFIEDGMIVSTKGRAPPRARVRRGGRRDRRGHPDGRARRRRQRERVGDRHGRAARHGPRHGRRHDARSARASSRRSSRCSNGGVARPDRRQLLPAERRERSRQTGIKPRCRAADDPRTAATRRCRSRSTRCLEQRR